MNNLSELLLEAANLLTEGAVKTNRKPERKLDKYLKKYEYDKNKGTIVIDGETIKVNRNAKSTAIFTDHTDEKHELHIDKKFKNLKNNKRRDSVLNHEIAHKKLQNLYDPNVTIDHKVNTVNSILDNRVENGEITSQKEYDKASDKLVSLVNRKGFKEEKDYNDKDKKQSKNLKIFDEYHKGGQLNSIEFEADAYARSQKNGSYLDRAMREFSKYDKKHNEVKYRNKKMSDIEKKRKEYLSKGYTKTDIKKMKDNVDRDIRNYHRKNNEEHVYRKKASTDKRIDRSAYQESVELLLIEAIDLLERE